MSCLYSLVFVVIVLLLLAGCVRQQAVAPPAQIESDPLVEELTRSARNVEMLWRRLARLTPSPSSGQPPGQNSRTPAPRPELALQKRISLSWTGELRALLRHLARLVHYSFHELGPRPALPLHTSLHLEDASVADILREAGLQAGVRAGVRVHGGELRRVELVYAK